jgi:hypothetical protein
MTAAVTPSPADLTRPVFVLSSTTTPGGYLLVLMWAMAQQKLGLMPSEKIQEILGHAVDMERASLAQGFSLERAKTLTAALVEAAQSVHAAHTD